MITVTITIIILSVAIIKTELKIIITECKRRQTQQWTKRRQSLALTR